MGTAVSISCTSSCCRPTVSPAERGTPSRMDRLHPPGASAPPPPTGPRRFGASPPWTRGRGQLLPSVTAPSEALGEPEFRKPSQPSLLSTTVLMTSRLETRPETPLKLLSHTLLLSELLQSSTIQVGLWYRRTAQKPKIPFARLRLVKQGGCVAARRKALSFDV